jgi:hypothetical protein
MVFGEVVSFVKASFHPIDVKLFLADAVTNPVEPHVNGLGSTLFDSVIGDANGGVVVCLDRSRGLGVAHFFEAGADGTSILEVVEEGTQFRFGGTGEDLVHGVAEDVDWSIQWWWREGWIRGTVAQVVVASGSGAGISFREVGGIAVNVEDHVTGMVADGSIGVGSTVVQELGGCGHGGSGALALLGCKGSNGW